MLVGFIARHPPPITMGYVPQEHYSDKAVVSMIYHQTQVLYRPLAGVTCPNPYWPLAWVTCPDSYRPLAGVTYLDPYWPLAWVTCPDSYRPLVGVTYLDPYWPLAWVTCPDSYQPLGIPQPATSRDDRHNITILLTTNSSISRAT